jgi:hypothetical protein
VHGEWLRPGARDGTGLCLGFDLCFRAAAGRSGFGTSGSARRISANAFKCHRRSLGVAGTITDRLASEYSKHQ